jgi:hypothetical protein
VPLRQSQLGSERERVGERETGRQADRERERESVVRDGCVCVRRLCAALCFFKLLFLSVPIGVYVCPDTAGFFSSTGAFSLAIETQIPIVPLVLDGTSDCLTAGKVECVYVFVCVCVCVCDQVS